MQVLSRPQLACTRRLVLIGVLALPALALPQLASGQETREERVEKAKSHYEAGSRLYTEARYEEAIKELQAAYDLTGEQTLLYNIAKSYEKLGDYEKAVRKYQDYVDLSPAIAATDKAEVERAIQDLLRKKEEALPELVISSNPRGADIYIDNHTKIRGQTPGKFRIEQGPHQVFLEKKGFEPLEKSFVMPSGKPLVLEFEMQPLEEYGTAQIVANVVGARVFIDGKNVGITPYSEMPELKIGFHQFIVEKEGYPRWEQRVEVAKGRTSLVTAELVRIQAPSSAPPVLGWTSLVLGGLCVGGGVVANYFAAQKFNDTADFKTMHNLTLTGYVGGGVLLGTAVTLLVYSLVRNDPRDALKGDMYGLSGTPGRQQLPLVGFGLDPVHRAVTLGAGLAF